MSVRLMMARTPKTIWVAIGLVALAAPGSSAAAARAFGVVKDDPCVQHACRATVVLRAPAGTVVDADFEHPGDPAAGFAADASQTCPAVGPACTLRIQSPPLQGFGDVPIAVRSTDASGSATYSSGSVLVAPDVRFYCNAALAGAGDALAAFRGTRLRTKPIPVELPGRGSADVRASTLVNGERVRLAQAGARDISHPQGTLLRLVLDAHGRKRATKALRSNKTLKILVEVRIHTFDGGQFRLGRTFTVKPTG